MHTMSSKALPSGNDFAGTLLTWLPVVALIVPQGAQEERSWILEGIFIGFCGLAALSVLARGSLMPRAPRVAREHLHPLLLVTLVYLGALNPLWSLLRGNQWYQVALTAGPLWLLGVYYLYALCGFGSSATVRLSHFVKVAGYLLASVIIINYFVSDLSAYDMRSAQIHNERNLALPLLPIAGVIALSDALTTSGPRPAATRVVGTIFIVTAILMTVTRAMLVAFIVGAALATLLLLRHAAPAVRRRAIKRSVAVACLGTASAMPFVHQWWQRFSLEKVEDVRVIAGRLDEYGMFLDLFTTSPLFGAGIGYVAIAADAASYMLSTEGVARPHSHLFFLAGTTGITGMILYYSVLASALRRVWMSCRTARRDETAVACLAGLAGGGVAGILYTLTTTMYTTLSYNIFLAVLIFASRVRWDSR